MCRYGPRHFLSAPWFRSLEEVHKKGKVAGARSRARAKADTGEGADQWLHDILLVHTFDQTALHKVT